ncbi:glycoside hydrolase family 9 protein [Micromonospora sp. CA-248260]|uniref:glycoside hydrolase family 9 protein n=1 Tax=Micromonospora sp. CA-248260 TaxID=3239962 RepID=UPI003D8D2DFB
MPHHVRRRPVALAAAALLALGGLAAVPQLASAAPDPGSPVKVNQVAYVPGLPKQATVVNSANSPLGWTLRNAGGATVASGQTTVRGTDALSGDPVHIADFSAYDTPGTGYVLSVGGSNSYPFDISADPVRRLRGDSLAFFYHQRSGTPIDAQYVGSRYARPAGHVNVAPNRGDNNVPCRTSCGYTLDVRGGWYDAGDQGKYVVNGGLSTWQLQNIYERTLYVNGADKSAVADGTLAIPERSNGVPDVLDEARWELEFLLKMQVPDGRTNAGMVHHKIHDQNWTALPTRPELDSEPRLLSPVSTAATLNMAAVAAQASRLWKPFDASFASRALAAAEKAYAAAKANPNRLAPATDNTGGGAYEDNTVTDEFYWAAAELYATTGSTGYRNDLSSSPHARGAGFTRGAYDWSWTAGLGDTTLVLVPTGLASGDVSAIRSAIVGFADRMLAQIANQGYPAPGSGNGTYYWGSNGAVANNANVLALAYDLTRTTRYRNGAFTAYDYLLGRNPLNQSYVAGYGDKPVRNLHHRFWANQNDGSLPTAPPGSLSGGPNSELQDPVVQAQLGGCKPQKCFIDDIGAYSVNEVAINWNAALAWLVHWAAEQAGSGTGPDPTPTPTVTPPPTTTPPPPTTTPPPPTTTPPPPTTTPPPAGGCAVTYSANSWSTGFTGSVTLANTSAAAWSSWRLTFRFTGNQQISQGWSGRFSQSGSEVTVTNESYNGAVAPNGSVNLGFNATYSGTNATPTGFAVNGTACTLR